MRRALHELPWTAEDDSSEREVDLEINWRQVYVLSCCELALYESKHRVEFSNSGLFCNNCGAKAVQTWQQPKTPSSGEALVLAAMRCCSSGR